MAIFDRSRRNGETKKAMIGRLGKSVLVAVVLALGVGGAGMAMAQGPKHDKAAKMHKWKNMSAQEKREKMEARVERRLERMTGQLELTEAQQVEIREIMTAGHERALELFEADGKRKGRRGMGKQLHKIKRETREQVRAVLTDEQAAKAKSLREQHRAERPQRMTQRLDERLDLSDEQKEQVEAILSEAQTDIQGLRGEEDGESAKGKRGRRWKKDRGEVRKIMKGAAADIESILTDEQAAEFAEIRKQMRERRGHHGKRHDKGGERGQE